MCFPPLLTLLRCRQRSPSSTGREASLPTQPSAWTGSIYSHAHAATKHVRAPCIPGKSRQLQPWGLSQLESPPPPFPPPGAGLAPAHHPHSEKRRASGGWETCSSGQLAISPAPMDHTEPGAVSAQPCRSHRQGLTAVLRIHTGLITFSMHKRGQLVHPAHRQPVGLVPGQHQSQDGCLGPQLPPRQPRLTIYTATKPSRAVGNCCLPKPSSVPAQVWDQSLLWQLQPASGWVFPLNRVLLGQLARSSCLFGVSE